MDDSSTSKLVLVGGEIITPAKALVGNLWVEGNLIDKIETIAPKRLTPRY